MLWDSVSRSTSNSIHLADASKEVVHVRAFANLGPSSLDAVRVVRALVPYVMSLKLGLLYAGHPVYGMPLRI